MTELTAPELLARAHADLQRVHALAPEAWSHAHDPGKSNWKVNDEVASPPRSEYPLQAKPARHAGWSEPRGLDAADAAEWRLASKRINDLHGPLAKLAKLVLDDDEPWQEVRNVGGHATAAALCHAVSTAMWTIRLVLDVGPGGYRDECMAIADHAHEAVEAIGEIVPPAATKRMCEECGRQSGYYETGAQRLCDDCLCKHCGERRREKHGHLMYPDCARCRKQHQRDIEACRFCEVGAA